MFRPSTVSSASLALRYLPRESVNILVTALLSYTSRCRFSCISVVHRDVPGLLYVSRTVQNVHISCTCLLLDKIFRSSIVSSASLRTSQTTLEHFKA
jgi:hypothetical protein